MNSEGQVFSQRDGRFRAVLGHSAMTRMERLSAAARNKETGGILIGAYSDDLSTALVREATPPSPDSRSGRDWLERGKIGLQELLLARWDDTPRSHYLGEWHFHTAAVPCPSGQDCQQMRTVAADPAYHCNNPLLVIVTPTSPKGFSFNVFVFPKGSPRVELAIERHPPLRLER